MPSRRSRGSQWEGGQRGLSTLPYPGGAGGAEGYSLAHLPPHNGFRLRVRAIGPARLGGGAGPWGSLVGVAAAMTSITQLQHLSRVRV